MNAMIPRIYRLGVVTCLAVVVVLVACTGGNEPAAPATTVAVGATTQPANTLVPAPEATPVPTGRAQQHSRAYAPTRGDSGGHARAYKHPGAGTLGGKCRPRQGLHQRPRRVSGIVQRYGRRQLAAKGQLAERPPVGYVVWRNR